MINLSSGNSRSSRRNENDRNNSITDLTFLGVGTSSSSTNNKNSPYLCEFCDIPLIKKMDDIKLLGTQDAGSYANTRFICCRCGNIKDPLKVADFDNLKRGERGQTIRSSNSGGGGSEEGTPFVEMFNSNNTSAADDNNDKGSSLRKGTQVSRALLQSIINNNDPEPNEESILRGPNMKIIKTTTEYPESGIKVVKTYYDDE